MFAELAGSFAIFLGTLGFIGLTTYYSIDLDTRRVIRRSIRALNKHQYFRYEHLLYLIVKAGQLRIRIVALALLSYIIYIIFYSMGI